MTETAKLAITAAGLLVRCMMLNEFLVFRRESITDCDYGGAAKMTPSILAIITNVMASVRGLRRNFP